MLPLTMWSGPWAIDPAALPLAHASPDAAMLSGGPEAAPVVDGVAVVRAAGVVWPRADPALCEAARILGCDWLAGRVEAAAEEADAVAVLFDSPGGSIAGVEEAAARISAVAAAKPVVAVADHMAASGAYWLAAACTAVVASPSSQVGSVGVIAVRPSFARALEESGVDVDVFTKGAGKTDGLTVVEMTDDGRRRWQARIDAYYAAFVRGVCAARGVAAATVTAEWGANVLGAEAARKAGMVDAVMTAREVVASLAGRHDRGQWRAAAAARGIMAAQIADMEVR